MSQVRSVAEYDAALNAGGDHLDVTVFEEGDLATLFAGDVVSELRTRAARLGFEVVTGEVLKGPVKNFRWWGSRDPSHARLVLHRLPNQVPSSESSGPADPTLPFSYGAYYGFQEEGFRSFRVSGATPEEALQAAVRRLPEGKPLDSLIDRDDLRPNWEKGQWLRPNRVFTNRLNEPLFRDLAVDSNYKVFPNGPVFRKFGERSALREGSEDAQEVDPLEAVLPQ